jgi:hypothetical protein
MKRIQYDNFKTAVSGMTIPTPEGPKEVRILQITDVDSGDVHEFAFPAADAAKIGSALQGTAVQTAPATALSDLKKARPPGGTPGR